MVQTMILVGVGIVGLFAIALLAFARVGLKNREALQHAATELGLAWTPGEGTFDMGEIRGTYQGQDIHVYHRTQDTGTIERTLTVVQIDLHPPIPVPFELGHENVVTKLRRWVLRRTDLEFDDPSFDALYYVRSDHPETIKRIFNATTRAALVRMGKGSDDLQVRSDRIRWESARGVAHADDVVRVVKAGCAAAMSIRAALPRSSRGAPVTG